MHYMYILISVVIFYREKYLRMVAGVAALAQITQLLTTLK